MFLQVNTYITPLFVLFFKINMKEFDRCHKKLNASLLYGLLHASSKGSVNISFAMEKNQCHLNIQLHLSE